MNNRNNWKRITALILSFLMLVSCVPVYAARNPEDKIWTDLKQVIEIVDENYLIDIMLEVETEEYISRFVETYLTDGRTYYVGKYSPRLDFYATENEIMEYIKADYVKEIWSEHVIPENNVRNIGSMKLSPEREQSIRADYYAKLNDPDILPEEIIISYYGTFNECDVVSMWVTRWLSNGITNYVRIGEYVLGSLGVHVGEEFISLTEAYEMGHLTDADLAQIPTAVRIFDGKHYADLSVEKENELKAAYIEELKTNKPYWIGEEEVQKLTLDDITILAYYGNHDGREVFVAVDETWDFSTGWTERRIGGYLFTFSNVEYYTNNLFAWEPGSFMLLKDACAVGEVSAESLCDIARISDTIIEPSELPYEDLDYEKDWYAYPAYKAYGMGVMTGMNETTFGAYELVSRAQFATILQRLCYPDTRWVGYYYPLYEDVKEDDWYAIGVMWATVCNIATGYQRGAFGAADPITREQMATMLYRYAMYKEYDTTTMDDLNDFSDAAAVSKFATTAIQWCVANGIILGKDGALKPQDHTTRAECAAMITRFAEKYAF